ncbi:MAG: hypothetical protein C4576_04295 [Desulfobacteraceae bacterium]|nr:MAG: hypothetical protein C4576_04295 [Desulfobacteraceae bacterium]
MLYRFGGKQPVVGKDTYVSDLASVIGDVIVGSSCYIGHGAILRGDYGRIEVGDGTAVEEGVIVHAPPGETNRIGKRVTIGRGAVMSPVLFDYRVDAVSGTRVVDPELALRCVSQGANFRQIRGTRRLTMTKQR